MSVPSAAPSIGPSLGPSEGPSLVPSLAPLLSGVLTSSPTGGSSSDWEVLSVAVWWQGFFLCALPVVAFLQGARAFDYYLVAACSAALSHSVCLGLGDWELSPLDGAVAVAAAVGVFCSAGVLSLWLFATGEEAGSNVGLESDDGTFKAQVKRELGIDLSVSPAFTALTAAALQTASAQVPPRGLPPPCPVLAGLPAENLRQLAGFEAHRGQRTAALWLQLAAAAAEFGEDAAGSDTLAAGTVGVTLGTAYTSEAPTSDPGAADTLAAADEQGIAPALRLTEEWNAAALLSALGHRSEAAAVFRAAATVHSPELRWLTGGDDAATSGSVHLASKLLLEFAADGLAAADAAADAGGGGGGEVCMLDGQTLGMGAGAPPPPEGPTRKAEGVEEAWAAGVEGARTLAPRAAAALFRGTVPPPSVLLELRLRPGVGSSPVGWARARVWAFHYSGRGVGEWCEAYRRGAVIGPEGQWVTPEGTGGIIEVRLGPSPTPLGFELEPDRLVVATVVPGTPADLNGVKAGWKVVAIDGRRISRHTEVGPALSGVGYISVLVSFIGTLPPTVGRELHPNPALLSLTDAVGGLLPPLPPSHRRLYIAPDGGAGVPPFTGSPLSPLPSVGEALRFAIKWEMQHRGALRLALLPGRHTAPVLLSLDPAPPAVLLVLEACEGAILAPPGGVEVPGRQACVLLGLVLEQGDKGYPALTIGTQADRVGVRECVVVPIGTRRYGGNVVVLLPDPRRQLALSGVWVGRSGSFRRLDDAVGGFPSSLESELLLPTLLSCWRCTQSPEEKGGGRRVMLLEGEATPHSGAGGLAERVSVFCGLLFILATVGLTGSTPGEGCNGMGLGGPCASWLAHASGIAAFFVGHVLLWLALRGRVMSVCRFGSVAKYTLPVRRRPSAASAVEPDGVDRRPFALTVPAGAVDPPLTGPAPPSRGSQRSRGSQSSEPLLAPGVDPP
eukprot:Hpha_TRINITY_DN16802_c1_g4::TRINITY_DN16802_c1_g4_i1::g.151043::m.151043